jgi:hypothetical protein
MLRRGDSNKQRSEREIYTGDAAVTAEQLQRLVQKVSEQNSTLLEELQIQASVRAQRPAIKCMCETSIMVHMLPNAMSLHP